MRKRLQLALMVSPVIATFLFLTTPYVQAEAGFGEEDLQKIGMAARECMVNAVLHGNQYDPDKRAGVRVELQNGGPVITNDELGYGWQTYPERLQAAGVSWKIYQDVGDGLDASLVVIATPLRPAARPVI